MHTAFVLEYAGRPIRREGEHVNDLHLSFDQYYSSANPFSLEQLEAALRGEARLYVGGRPFKRELTSQEFAAYERAKRRRFVILEKGDRMVDFAYYDFCTAAGICYVRVVPDAKAPIDEDAASISYDFFRLRRGLTTEALAEVRKSFERVRPGVYQQATLDLDAVCGYGLVPEYAVEKLAAALVDLFATVGAHTPESFYQVYPKVGQARVDSEL